MPGEVYSSALTGAVSAYYRLAYNLYLIAHNSKHVQTRLLSRLKNKGNFQGAFFETQVAAWFVKAGFELDFEDESDVSVSHCEFNATYLPTGKKFSIEAKSRNPADSSVGPKRITVAKQLRSALRKKVDHTRVVFLDLHRRITTAHEADRLVERARRALQKVEPTLEIDGQPAPPAHVCLTNITDQYFPDRIGCTSLLDFGGFKMPDAIGTKYPTIRDALRGREKNIEMVALLDSIKLHSDIPITFDGALPSVAFAKSSLSQMIIGRGYLRHCPDGVERLVNLTTATVDTKNKVMVLAFHLEEGDVAWIDREPMSDEQLVDYIRHPDTFFGVVKHASDIAQSPLGLFDFVHSAYRDTPKERLLELLVDAPDIAEISLLSQSEIREIFCERTVYGMLGLQQA